jgi:hypothetical protein
MLRPETHDKSPDRSGNQPLLYFTSGPSVWSIHRDSNTKHYRYANDHPDYASTDPPAECWPHQTEECSADNGAREIYRNYAQEGKAAL